MGFFELGEGGLGDLARHFVVLGVACFLHGGGEVQGDDLGLVRDASIDAEVELALVLEVLLLARLFNFLLLLSFKLV